MDHLRESASIKNPIVVGHATIKEYRKTPVNKKNKIGNSLSKYFFHEAKFNDLNPISFCIYHKEKSLQGCIKDNNVQYLEINKLRGIKI